MRKPGLYPRPLIRRCDIAECDYTCAGRSKSHMILHMKEEHGVEL